MSTCIYHVRIPTYTIRVWAEVKLARNMYTVIIASLHNKYASALRYKKLHYEIPRAALYWALSAVWTIISFLQIAVANNINSLLFYRVNYFWVRNTLKADLNPMNVVKMCPYESLVLFAFKVKTLPEFPPQFENNIRKSVRRAHGWMGGKLRKTTRVTRRSIITRAVLLISR